VELNVFTFDYSEQREWFFFLASDLHIGHIRFDRELFDKQFREAKEMGAKILINGDLFDAITPSDRKRYHPSGDKYKIDAHLNAAIDEAYKLLKPYAEDILLIGHGNHEASTVRWSGIDPIQMLARDFGREGTYIRLGGYTGFARLVFTDKGSRSRTYDIYYNHGQGGSAEVTKGMIGLQRRNNIIANVVWLGHSHTAVVTQMDALQGVSSANKLVSRTRLGVITGSFTKVYRPEYNINETGYMNDYEEEHMRTPHGRGGIFLRLKIGGADSTISTRVMSDY